jgi:hypothetical protein
MEPMPVFIKIDDSRELKKLISQLNTKIENVRNTLGNMEKLFHEESSKINEFRGNMKFISENTEKMGQTGLSELEKL